MFIADGSITTPLKTVWEETVTVAPNTPYIFSYWAASSFDFPAVLRTTINNVQIGDFYLPRQTGEWVKFEVVWNSGTATSATIRLVDLNRQGGGNDFVLDDISMQMVPEPTTVWLFSIGLTAVALRRGGKSNPLWKRPVSTLPRSKPMCEQ